jgi:hypothetical protein
MNNKIVGWKQKNKNKRPYQSARLDFQVIWKSRKLKIVN